jgi:hypothetical protein
VVRGVLEKVAFIFPRMYRVRHGAQRCSMLRLWIAICVYVLMAIVRKEPQLDLSLSQILQALSVNAFEQVPMAELVANVQSPETMTAPCNQLMLWS